MDTPAAEGAIASQKEHEYQLAQCKTKGQRAEIEDARFGRGPVRHAKVNKTALREAGDGVRWHPNSISKEKAAKAKHKTV